MGEHLIKPYEISVWEDKLTPITGTNPVEYKFDENKLAVIGSDTMTGLNKIYNPVFHKKTNGEKTLTFSLKYKYFDPYLGNSDIVNPFADLLVNERKVKLKYGKDEQGNDQWYEFIIKDHTESSDGLEWTYTCIDAFVLELSKTGYNITFDAELNNNQGTAIELAKETLKDTDWKLGGVDNLKQLVAEPIYNGVVQTNFNVLDTDTNEITEVTEGTLVYIFYSYIKNKDNKFIQFIKKNDNDLYTIDNNNVITATNYRIVENNIIITETEIQTSNRTPLITIGLIETKFQANRLAYNQLTTYDPVMGRTVDRFKVDNGDLEIYKYTDYVYTTSNIVMNYITNGDNFNVLEDGSLQGWSPYTDQISGEPVNKLELITRPELGIGKQLVDLNNLSEIRGFLKVRFNGYGEAGGGKFFNTIYNSGFENNASFIKTVSKGDKFVFRWRATGNINNLSTDKANTLKAFVAKYTQDMESGYYYKHINPNDIIIQFNTNPKELNNIITGGKIVDNGDNTQSYVINNVPQTPSNKYIYVSNETYIGEYVWNGNDNRFESKNSTNYLPYYYITGEALQGISNAVLTDPTQKIGIFIYSTNMDPGQHTYFIQDIQLTRFIPDVKDNTGQTPILIGNIPTATSTPIDYYYFKPAKDAVAEDIITYTSLDELKRSEKLSPQTTISPLRNENSEKNLSISASKSNCFNILQTIAETFECWVDLVVEHNDQGYITKTNNKPNKYVYLREYVGKDNYAGFKYGINLNSIERTINSDEIVTKLIVDQSQSEYTDEGFVSIASAPSNPSGESYILNFEYYYNQNLLDRNEVEADKLKFIKDIEIINSDLRDYSHQKADDELSLVELSSKRNVYTELIATAENTKNESLEKFEKLTGRTYSKYQSLQHTAISYNNRYYILTQDTTVQRLKTYYIYSSSEMEEIENPTGNPKQQGWYETLVDLSEEETVLDTLGEIYTCSATINNYAGLLTTIEQEYQDVRKRLYGSENYSIKIWTENDFNKQRHVYFELNDYLPGFSFTFGGESYVTTLSKKYFDILNENSTQVIFTTPEGYTINPGTYTISNDTVKTIKITSTESFDGINDLIEQKQEEKLNRIKKFNNTYSRYIQEGTWSSTDYIDPERYYLDALQVSNTSAQPVVSYSINVVEVSQLEGLELYSFDVGDKSYIEDTEFFGWSNVNGNLTPAREEVIVSEVEWHLDRPEENILTVQNYKTRFEDLFQRISATVQTVQYNEATYAKMSSLLDANGTLNQNVLLESLNNVGGKGYTLTSDGSVIVNKDQILVQNLNNPANRVILNSEGLRVSSDGGQTWKTVISGEGINIGAVYTGTLNTQRVIIGSSDNPSFRWDKSGISAYRKKEDGVYDLKTYVRYDEYGLYGIQNGLLFKAESIEDVEDKAHFAVTWNGFFIRNSYTNGRVEITSNNDFRVIQTLVDNNDQYYDYEKIKIGALEFDAITGQPTKYGININRTTYNQLTGQWEITPVFTTGDDGNITITGTIYANSGEIGGMIVNHDYLSMQTIMLEPGVGIYSTLFTNNEPIFSISDVNGSATFNNVTARGHIDALTGTLGNLNVIDTIVVGDSNTAGTIQSTNYINNISGWSINSNGYAEFANANVRGHIEAQTGDFTGWIAVGDRTQNSLTNPWIVISGGVTDAARAAHGSKAVIKTSNYQDGAGYGWMINSDGDAYFNNITARGAIKTAVFEYAEIQAVGGIFLFRPSSIIKGARVGNPELGENQDNLILKVEKPLLFEKISYNKISAPNGNPHSQGWYERTNYGYALTNDISVVFGKDYFIKNEINSGSWCKVSNYITNNEPIDSTIQNILLTNGLSHVYQVINVNATTKEITLANAASMVVGENAVTTLAELEGGALIDMGREDGTTNYGIGVNSSDNTVNLPARAISLFETEIQPNAEDNIRVTYNYRGILGTLPILRYGYNQQVHTLYHNYMEHTQGIYTDNIYIGDSNQYLAFYTDNNGNKHLRISAQDMIMGYDPDTSREITWEEYIEEAAQGKDGKDGTDVITVRIESNVGNEFIMSNEQARLTCTVYQGNVDITNTVTKFTWTKLTKDGVSDNTWNQAHENYNNSYIDIGANEVNVKAIFNCHVTIPDN